MAIKARPAKKSADKSAPTTPPSQPDGPSDPASPAGISAEISGGPKAADAGDPILQVLGHSTRLGPLLSATWPRSGRKYVSPNVALGLRAASFLAPAEGKKPGKHKVVDATGLLLGTLALSKMMRSSWIARLLDVLTNAGHPPPEHPDIAAMHPLEPQLPANYSHVQRTLLRWDAVKLLADAAALRGETNRKNETIGLRHLWFAALFSAEGQLALNDLGLLDAGLGPLVDALAEMVESRTVPMYSDDTEAWSLVVERARGQSLLVQTRKLRSGFSPDVVTNETDAAAGEEAGDPLGTRVDAVALADLILLDAAKPPLAIGLLGSWGSGKSTLMYRLREEIQRQIIAQRQGTEPSDATPETKRVGNVAQLNFNAWSFADSKNLWASLTAEIFEQLKAGGSDTLRGQRGEGLVQEVADKLARHEGEGAARPKADAIKKRLDRLQADVRAKSLEAGAAQLHAVAAAQLVWGDATPFERRLKQALPREDDAIALAAHGKGAGRAWWLAKRVYPGWLRAAAIVAALAFLAGMAVLIFVPQSRGLLTVAATIAAPFAAALAIIGKPILNAFGMAARYEELVHLRKAKLARETAVLQGQVEAKTAELDRARRDEERRAATAASLAETKGHPARLLQYLLSESADIQSIKAQVGLMATVRRCFETLDELIKRHVRLAREETEAGKDKEEQDPPIERIILYIDDLDRCSAEQVVKVLEAVHLLLAFECFVVIVAIDARWLHRSLQISHPQFQRISVGRQAARDDGEESGNAKEGDAESEPEHDLPSPSDYLEKIFQIPFWVRTLEPAAGTTEAPPAESPYTRYLVTLLGPRPGARTEEREDEGSGAVDPKQAAKASGLQPEPPAAPKSLAIDMRARIERVSLNADERRLLDELGPLAARSPRAIKRLVNIYRLIKAGVPQAHAHAFMGGGSKEVASFSSILFVLALDAGLSAQSVAAVRRAVAKLSEQAWREIENEPRLSLSPVYRPDPLGAPVAAPRHPHSGALVRALGGNVEGFILGLQALRKVRGAPTDQEDMARAFAVTQRYSFRST